MAEIEKEERDDRLYWEQRIDPVEVAMKWFLAEVLYMCMYYYCLLLLSGGPQKYYKPGFTSTQYI